MNICNVTSNNFNLDCNGKDMQIEVYEQLIKQLQQENKQLKMIVNEYEKLNKGFKITNVQEYNIDELLSYKKYKDNWNKLKEYIKTEIPEDVFIDTEFFVSILDKIQELEKGSDNKC